MLGHGIVIVISSFGQKRGCPLLSRGYYVRGVYKVENRALRRAYKAEKKKIALRMEEVCTHMGSFVASCMMGNQHPWLPFFKPTTKRVTCRMCNFCWWHCRGRYALLRSLLFRNAEWKKEFYNRIGRLPCRHRSINTSRNSYLFLIHCLFICIHMVRGCVTSSLPMLH